MPLSTTNWLNDATDVQVTKDAENAAPHISLNIADGVHSGVTCGKLMGPDTSFNAVEADRRASVLVYAQGIPMFSYQRTAVIGTKINETKEYNRVDLYEDNVTVRMTAASITLDNTPIWLSSGGQITQEYPNTVGEYRQMVGHPIATDEWVVNIQDAHIIGPDK